MSEKRRPFRMVRLPDDLYRQLAALAESEDLPTTRFIVRLLRRHVRRVQERDRNGSTDRTDGK